MAEQNLKPCPFCGCKNIVVRKYTAIAGIHYYAQCDQTNGGCGAICGWKATKEDAITAWNTRTPKERGDYNG